VEDTQDRDDTLPILLCHQVGDHSALPVRGGPQAGAYVVMSPASRREGGKGLDVSANRDQESLGEVGGRPTW
jgi:hypothetical protein